MNLFYNLLILFIISIYQSNSLDDNHYKEYYSESTPYKEALTDLDNGKCIRFIRFYSAFLGIKLGKIIFCPSFVIDNENNRKALLINSSDYFYNNLDFKSLGNSIYERHSLINLNIKCNNQSQEEKEINKFNEFNALIESSNCKSNAISINKQPVPLKLIIESQYQANKYQIPTTSQFESIYLKYLNSKDTIYIDVNLFRETNKTSIGKVSTDYKKELQNDTKKINLNYISFFSDSDGYSIDETNYDYVYIKLVLAYFIQRYQKETNLSLPLDSKLLSLFSTLKANESINLIILNNHNTPAQASFQKTILLLLFKHDFDLNIIDSDDPIPQIGQILTRNEIQTSKLFLLNELYANSKFESYNYNQLDLLYSSIYENFLKQNLKFDITRSIEYILNEKENINPNDFYLKSLILNREFETGKKLEIYNQLKIFNQFKDLTTKESNYLKLKKFFNENKDSRDTIKQIVSSSLFSIDLNEFKKMYDNLYYNQLKELMKSE